MMFLATVILALVVPTQVSPLGRYAAHVPVPRRLPLSDGVGFALCVWYGRSSGHTRFFWLDYISARAGPGAQLTAQPRQLGARAIPPLVCRWYQAQLPHQSPAFFDPSKR